MAGEVTRKQQKQQITAADPPVFPSNREHGYWMGESKNGARDSQSLLQRYEWTGYSGSPQRDVTKEKGTLESEKAIISGEEFQGIECDPAMSICSTKTKSRIGFQLPALSPSHPIVTSHELVTIIPISFLPPSSHQCEHAHVNNSSSTGKTSSETL